MLSLDQEIAALRASGELDERAAARLIALERREVFSLHYEFRALLYIGVTLLVGGVGAYLRRNLYRIGPAALIAGIGVVAAGCYLFVLLRRGKPSLAHDYLLLLGALLVSADIGYAETQYHMLDARWSWHLLLLALFHAACAYGFSSRVLLSVSITSLAAFFGIQRTADFGLFAGPDLAVRMIACAAVLLAWRRVHVMADRGRSEFVRVFDHAIALLSIVASLILVIDGQWRWIGLLMAFAFSAASIAYGWRYRVYTFLVYGVVGGIIAAANFFVQVVRVPSLTLLFVLGSMIAAIVFLFWSWRRLKEEG